MSDRLSADLDAAAVNLIRGLAMDAPLAAKSGHQGTAMALAPLAHVLFSRVMRYDPADPAWPDRDRFILSAGHASILQYAMLFLTGQGLTLEDIRAFRQWDSLTPGHPEAGHTIGVEVTTGPLGQGLANAVGMAIAESHLRAVHGAACQDHRIWVIAGDGCLMEGISHEAASLAGHLGLERLVCIYDDNRVTIDGSTDLSCSDDVVGRFRSYNWNVVEAGDIGEDLDALEAVLLGARSHLGSPTLVVLRTHIGHPSPDLTDSPEAHGNPFTSSHVTATKAVMRIPDEPFWAPDDVVQACRSHSARRGAAARAAWESGLGEAGREFLARWQCRPAGRWDESLPRFDESTGLATRQAFQKVLAASADALPFVLAGSADLTGNTGVKLADSSSFTAETPGNAQIYYGIREHAMGAAMVGMALHGGVLPVGGTFFVFADYLRPALRLAALSRARCVFVFSHDSVGVGEDGPTHQPVEHLATLRAIPGLQVIRPADPNETREAWVRAVGHDGPTALVLSRQTVASITDGSAVEIGAGVVRDHPSPAATIVATGSELSVAVAAHELLAGEGIHTSVVSLPSWDRFESAPSAVREQILPSGRPTVSVEAATTFGWARWAQRSIGIDRFGASAPGAEALTRLGITPEAVADAVRTLLN